MGWSGRLIKEETLEQRPECNGGGNHMEAGWGEVNAEETAIAKAPEEQEIAGINGV